MKISLPRGLEISKFLATKAGQELSDLVQYIADLSENVIRALNSGLTLEDNFNGKSLTVSLKHNTEQIVNTDNKVPKEISVRRVFSTTVGWDSVIWYVNASGQTVVKVGLTGAPAGSFDVSLAILFS